MEMDIGSRLRVEVQDPVNHDLIHYYSDAKTRMRVIEQVHRAVQVEPVRAAVRHAVAQAVASDAN